MSHARRPCEYGEVALGTTLLIFSIAVSIVAILLQFKKSKRERGVLTLLQTKTVRRNTTMTRRDAIGTTSHDDIRLSVAAAHRLSKRMKNNFSECADASEGIRTFDREVFQEMWAEGHATQLALIELIHGWIDDNMNLPVGLPHSAASAQQS